MSIVTSKKKIYIVSLTTGNLLAVHDNLVDACTASDSILRPHDLLTGDEYNELLTNGLMTQHNIVQH